MQKIVYIDLDGVVANFEKGKQNHPCQNGRYYTEPYEPEHTLQFG